MSKKSETEKEISLKEIYDYGKNHPTSTFSPRDLEIKFGLSRVGAKLTYYSFCQDELSRNRTKEDEEELSNECLIRAIKYRSSCKMAFFIFVIIIMIIAVVIDMIF